MTKVLAVAMAVLAFCSVASAARVDLSTRDLEKRDAWIAASTFLLPTTMRPRSTSSPAATSGLSTAAWTLSGTGVITTNGTPTFIDCIHWCNNTQGCKRVTFTGSVQTGGTCYLKVGGSPLKSAPGVKVATLITDA